MTTDGEAARPRDAEIQLTNIRSASKPALARPPPTRRIVRKGRLKFLYFGFRAAWANKDYATIISIANKLPGETLQEDEKLLTLYDLALTRTEEN